MMVPAMVCGWPRVRIPPACSGVEVVIGIDEAGRGPVLGSLVYVAAFWPVSEHEEISKLGFDDSKQLKEEKREEFFHKIRSHGSIGWVIEEVSAKDLSKNMLRSSPVSLNALSFQAVITALETIRDADNGPKVGGIFVDTVGDAEYYKSTLTRALGQDFGTFTIEKKADATYRVVSAASIIAKVTRDTLMKEFVWEEPYLNLSRDYGSGYPGDENCVRWLSSTQQVVFGYPSIVRFSWSTTREALEKSGACKVEWECDEDQSLGGADIKNYFAVGAKKPVKRSDYFTRRKMKRLDDSFLR